MNVHFSAGARVLEEEGPWAVLGGTWRARGARAYDRGLRAEPLLKWSGGQSPLKLKVFLALGRATDRANLYPLQYFQQSIIIR